MGRKYAIHPMKTALSAQQLVYFRKQGYVRFENYPLDFADVKKIANELMTPRDLWRKNSFLKKFLLHTLGAMALELARKPSLRLACDHYLVSLPKITRIQDMFCFQGLACIFVFSVDEDHPELGTILEIFEPSSLANRLPKEGYLVAFALENGVLIENQNDPFNAATRNLGYVYGDRLMNPHHPLVIQR